MQGTATVIEAFERTQTLAEWSAETGLSRAIIRRRIRSGCPPEFALKLPRGARAKREWCWDAIPFEQDPFAQYVAGNVGPMTLEDVAHIMGISREAVRQIELAALRKMRRQGKLEELLDAANDNGEVWDGMAIGGWR